MEAALIAHPETTPRHVAGVRASARRADGDELIFTFELSGELAQIVIPPPAAAPTRVDELWRTTCFEAFLGTEGDERYCEFNFSPSGRWAAYAFDTPRSGMRSMTLAAEPVVTCARTKPGLLSLTARLTPRRDEIEPTRKTRLGLTAVIETIDGAKSYWALTHAPGKPDFHNPANRLGRLATLESS